MYLHGLFLLYIDAKPSCKLCVIKFNFAYSFLKPMLWVLREYFPKKSVWYVSNAEVNMPTQAKYNIYL